MNVRDAILAAADHIERNPHQYLFDLIHIPHSIAGRGCVLGWIGYFLGKDLKRKDKWANDLDSVAYTLNFPGTIVAYQRLNNLGTVRWIRDHNIAAQAMRRLAEEYPVVVDTPAPAEFARPSIFSRFFRRKNSGIPASVRNIFKMSREEVKASLERIEE